jgi:hypothetical protein
MSIPVIGAAEFDQTAMSRDFHKRLTSLNADFCEFIGEEPCFNNRAKQTLGCRPSPPSEHLTKLSD